MSSTSKQSSTSSKGEGSSSKNEATNSPNAESGKITSFFPILRGENRAKMSATKPGDSKQKEILQKLKNKDSASTKSKSDDAKLPSNQKAKAAPKTPLSQAVRKSVEASETKKELEEAMENSEVSGNDGNDISEEVAPEMEKLPQRAKKSFPETETTRALRYSQKSTSESIPSPSLRSQIKKSDATAVSSKPVKRRVTVSEQDVSPLPKSSRVSSQPSPIPSATGSQSSMLDGDQADKFKRKRRKQFRGGTYGLFLSKKSKKKGNKPKGQEDSKDDECSLAGTENSSYFDSDDGNSLMSEDIYTPSEKSLADDDGNQDVHTSPTLGSNTKPVDSEINFQNQSNIKMESVKETEDDVAKESKDEEDQDGGKNEPELAQADDTMHWEPDSKFEDPSQVGDVDSETMKTPQYDDISNESFSNSTTFPFKTSEDKVKKDEAITEETEEMKDETEEMKDETDQVAEDETVAESNAESKDFTNMFGNLEDSNPASSTQEKDANLDSSGHDQEMDGTAASMPNSGDEHESENMHPLQSDSEYRESGDSKSTITTCVKSRQRIKRRFTDDVVDTDVGMFALNPSAAPPRKVPPKSDPPKDVIQTFPTLTHCEAKKGPITRLECIYNTHQEPIKTCDCEGETYEANLGSEDDGVFCQAVDSIDDKLVGCSNPVVTARLVRSSVKLPFTIMCEMHLWRLKHHHSCPYCGLFCSQGSFMQCTNASGKQRVMHLYHEHCQPKEEGIVPFCLHCGTTTGMKRVTLEMHMASPPSFYLSQLPTLPVPYVEKARMLFSSSSDLLKAKEEEMLKVSYRIPDTGKVLSSVGLNGGPETDELDRLLNVLNEESVVPILSAADELYNAAAEKDTIKVLNILAQGVDPNKKFDSHEKATALHAAAAAGHTTIVHLLILAGAVNDALNDKLYTPLMMAVENGHKDVVFYLIKTGAVADFKGENGMSSVHIAAKTGSLEILKILMTSRDMDINAQDDGGWTPIVWASEHDHYDVVQYLLKRGANPNIQDNEGNTGLHWSAFSGSVDICFLYLDYGCDINAVNELGDTPLHIAARQDSLPCVTLFLSRGAEVMVRNKANLTPSECIIDKNGDTYLSLSLNMLLKKISSKYKHKVEKILHRDISRGKESNPIQCVNDVDDEPPPVDFLYVTENCETTPTNIDRTITSLQSCHCEDDCSTTACTCSSISYQCWYDKDGLLLPNFNIVDPPMLFECNRACSCWTWNCRNRVLQNGMTCRLQLIRTKGKGWGVRTLKDIPKGTFICEYVGEMISDSAADKRADDSYLFDLDNRDGETYCLDARYYGNISRFINHLCEPNLVPVKIYVDHQDLNFPRIAFFSSRDIKQYEELGFDYSEKFWVIKYKYFTCDCGSAKCKYSTDTIHTTLANYYKRQREETIDETVPQQPLAQETQPIE